MEADYDLGRTGHNLLRAGLAIEPSPVTRRYILDMYLIKLTQVTKDIQTWIGGPAANYEDGIEDKVWCKMVEVLGTHMRRVLDQTIGPQSDGRRMFNSISHALRNAIRDYERQGCYIVPALPTTPPMVHKWYTVPYGGPGRLPPATIQHRYGSVRVRKDAFEIDSYLISRAYQDVVEEIHEGTGILGAAIHPPRSRSTLTTIPCIVNIDWDKLGIREFCDAMSSENNPRIRNCIRDICIRRARLHYEGVAGAYEASQETDVPRKALERAIAVSISGDRPLGLRPRFSNMPFSAQHLIRPSDRDLPSVIRTRVLRVRPGCTEAIRKYEEDGYPRVSDVYTYKWKEDHTTDDSIINVDMQPFGRVWSMDRPLSDKSGVQRSITIPTALIRFCYQESLRYTSQRDGVLDVQCPTGV